MPAIFNKQLQAYPYIEWIEKFDLVKDNMKFDEVKAIYPELEKDDELSKDAVFIYYSLKLDGKERKIAFSFLKTEENAPSWLIGKERIGM